MAANITPMTFVSLKTKTGQKNGQKTIVSMVLFSMRYFKNQSGKRIKNKEFKINIFVLDESPYFAAVYQCDKHVIKMILESCQLLCSVFPPELFSTIPYKRTHYNHPCAIWVRTSKANFDWLSLHTMHLIQEYQRRYKKEHKCQEVLEWVWKHEVALDLFNYIPDHAFKWKQKGLTSFPQCMPEQYKVIGNPVQAYRNYYKGDKVRFAKWEKGSPVPSWWK